MGHIILAQNRRVLGESQVTLDETLHAIVGKICPFDGQCHRKAIIYQGTVKAQNMQNYVGLCETKFKTRLNNHKQSFKNRRLQNVTELSKYIWLCKHKGKNF